MLGLYRMLFAEVFGLKYGFNIDALLGLQFPLGVLFADALGVLFAVELELKYGFNIGALLGLQ